MNENQRKHQRKIGKLSLQTVTVRYCRTSNGTMLHETYAVLQLCLTKVSFRLYSAKEKS